MKIDNMREEHQEKLIKDAEKLARAAGRGREEAGAAERSADLFPYPSVRVSAEIFKGLGVDYLIEGGQTMNPSTEDMLNAIDKVNAETCLSFSRTTRILFWPPIRPRDTDRR